MKTKPVILVTGATGKTGGALVRELIREGWPVRALVRAEDARGDRLRALGAEVVAADLFDPEQLAAAMRGARRAYFVPPMKPYMIQAAGAFAVAAREAGLESIVQMSQWTSNPSHPSLHTRQIWLVDRLFATLPGVTHTILNPGYFADNILRLIDYATLLGVLPVLTGTSRSAPVANEDIARVAARVLMDPDAHAGKRYRPTGPRLISGRDAAEMIGDAIGRRVVPFDLPEWMFLKVARMQGVDPFQIHSLRDYLEDHRRGVFEFQGGVNDTVRELTGSPAEDFQTTARRYAALPFARVTTANRLRAVANFLRTPFHPGYDLDRFARDRDFPKASAPVLSADSATWLREHAAPALQPALSQ